MATQNRAPTADGGASGDWTGAAGTRYQAVDDYPDTVPNDYLDHGTISGYILFDFTAFSIPTGATAITVQVRYHDQDVSAGVNALQSRLKVGGTSYNFATSHNPGNTLTAREDDWTTNPKTAAAWTVDDVNGVGANALEQFGVRSNDANPAIRISGIELQVTYTPGGVNGSLTQTLGTLTKTIDGDVAVQGSLAKTLAALTLAASGQVGIPITGSLAKTLAALTLGASGEVEVRGSLAKTLGALTLSSAGTVGTGLIVGTLAKTLGALTGPMSGTVALVGTLTRTLAPLTGVSFGSITSVWRFKTKREETAQVVILDVEPASYVGFPGLAHEWIADITFLDMLELQAWIYADEATFLMGPATKTLTPVTAQAVYDVSNWDQGEWT